MYICKEKPSLAGEGNSKNKNIKYLCMNKCNKSYLIEYKGSQLFSDSEVIDRKSTSQEDFIESYGAENAYKQVVAIEKGLEQLQDDLRKRPRSFINRNYCPNTLNANIQGQTMSAFPQESKFIENGRYCIMINGFKCLVKKLNKHLMPNNILTRAVDIINHQKSETPDDKQPIVIIGYVVSKDYSRIENVYAIHTNSSGQMDWCCDLASLAATYVNQSATVLPSSPSEPIVSVKVKDTIMKKTV